MKKVLGVLLPCLGLVLTACGGDSGRGGEPAEVKRQSLVFSAVQDEQSGYEPWLTDGTAAGTRKLKEINAAEGSYPSWPVRLGERMLFSADDGIHGSELWISDGSKAGTRQLVDINPSGDGRVRYLTLFQDKVFFVADDGVHGNELWVTDGSVAGTRLFHDTNDGANGAFPFGLTVVGELLYFSADGGEGKQLWVTNGGPLEGDTTAVSITDDPAFSSPESITAYRDGVIFSARTASYGYEPYFAEGRSAKRLADINVGTANSHPYSFTVINDKVIFTASETTHGREMWVYDGNDVAFLHDITPGINGSVFQSFQVFDDKLFFTLANNNKVFITTGQPVGLTSALIGGGVRFRMLASNSQYLFMIGERDGKRQLWVSEGDAMSIRALVVDNMVDVASRFAVLNDELLFVASSAGQGFELWRSNGSAAGTRMVKDINPDMESSDPYLDLSNYIR